MYIDIDIDEVYSELSRSERNTLIDYLVEDGLVTKLATTNGNVSVQSTSYLDDEWQQVIDKLSGSNRLRLSNEDEEAIRKIANKY